MTFGDFIVGQLRRSKISDILNYEPTDQRIVTNDPDVAAKLRQQAYLSKLQQLASVDPDRFGGAYMESISPDAQLDRQLKQMEMENAQAGGYLGDGVAAQAANKLLKSGMDPNKVAMMMTPGGASALQSLQQQQAVQGILGGNSGGLYPQELPQSSLGEFDNLIEQIRNPLQQMAGRVARVSTGGGGIPTPDILAQKASELMSGMAGEQAAGAQTVVGESQSVQPTMENQSAQQPMAQARYAQPLPLDQWVANTTEGQLASVTNDPQKIASAYDSYSKRVMDMNKAAQDEVKNKIDMTDKQRELATKQQVNPSTDTVVKSIDRLLSNPSGIEWITGRSSAIPNPDDGFFGSVATLLSPESRLDAISDIKTIKDIQKIQNLNDARTVLGGSYGNMTEKEWPMFENIKENLGQTQSAERYTQGLKDLRDLTIKLEDRRIKLAGGEGYVPNDGEKKEERISFDSEGNRIEKKKEGGGRLVYDPTTGTLQ